MRENLEDDNENVLKIVEDMLKQKCIHKFTINNGFIKIFETAGRRPIKINHPDDLYTYFPDYFDIFPDYRYA